MHVLVWLCTYLPSDARACSASPTYLHSVTAVNPQAPGDERVSLSNENFGLVYLNLSGHLGTVCDDIFEDNDNACQVVCRQLGYR